MSIIVGKNTKVITQGITGKSGEFHTKLSHEYAPRFVGGVTELSKMEGVNGMHTY